MKRGRLPRQLVMGPQDIAKVLTRLASIDVDGSNELYARLMGSWGNRPDRAYITFRPTTSERLVLRQIPLPAKVVQCAPRFVAVYRCNSKPQVEVILRTNSKPPRVTKLKITGGARRFTLIKLYQTKESITMAAKGTKKAPAKKADPVDELEAELEGLEEIDIEEEEDEEPEVEEDEDDEEEDDDAVVDYSGMTNADLKELCKKRGIKGIAQANKTKLIALLEAADAAGDDDDEEEDDGLDELDRAGLKAKMAEMELRKAKKSDSDDDLRALIRENMGDDEEEDEEEEEEEEDDDPLEGLSRAELKAYNTEHELGVRVVKSMSDDDLRAALASAVAPPAKPTGGKKAPAKKGGKQPNQLIRKLPTGRLGANDIADMAGMKAINVRNFLRANADKFPKNVELNRYAFTQKQATAIVKAMAAGRTRTTKK